jgi:hypothetical protein
MAEFIPNQFPVVERITQNIVAALKEITTANGYTRDVRRVERVRAVPENPEDMSILVYRDDPEPYPEKLPYEKSGYTQQYSIVFFVAESERSDVPIDQRLALFEADIIKALMKDPRRGGLTFIDSRHVGTALLPEPLGGCCGGTVYLDVPYRTPRNDPYRIA